AELELREVVLPKLDGTEAARRIRGVETRCKILFVSENRFPDIVGEALSTGAGGFVLKSDAASELLPGAKAVLDGKRFVSASLAGHYLVTTMLTSTHAMHLSWMSVLISGIR